MPNWVSNRLTVDGPDSENVLDSICKINDGERDIDFNKILPMPESLNITCGGGTDSCVELYLTYINPAIAHYGQGRKISEKEFADILEKLGENEWGFIKQMNAENYPGICKFRRDLSPAEIARILESRAEHEKMDEQAVFDYGKKAVDNVLSFGAMTWYEWCNDNWGTKWNAADSVVTETVAYFNTAWSPVCALIERLAGKYPDNTFIYEYAEEQGGLYAGKYVFQNGIHEDGGDFAEDSKEAWELYFDLFGGEEDYRFNEETGKYEYINQEDDVAM